MRTLLFLLLILVWSCTSGDNAEQDAAPVDPTFQQFLDQFPAVNLPLSIKGCVDRFEGLTFFDETNSSPFVEDYSFAFGQLETKGAYKAVITLTAADCLLPVLNTYQPDGTLIDRKTIAIGQCGTAPCFECEEFMSMDLDLALFTADTITTATCDSNYQPIAGTEKVEVIYKKGKLLSTGKIELSASIKRALD